MLLESSARTGRIASPGRMIGSAIVLILAVAPNKRLVKKYSQKQLHMFDGDNNPISTLNHFHFWIHIQQKPIKFGLGFDFMWYSNLI